MAHGERRFLGSPRGSRGLQAAVATGCGGQRGALALARPAGLENFALAPRRPRTAMKTPRFWRFPAKPMAARFSCGQQRKAVER